jgi:hypothetical protein
MDLAVVVVFEAVVVVEPVVVVSFCASAVREISKKISKA